MRVVINEVQLINCQLRFKCDSFAIIYNKLNGDYFNLYQKNMGVMFEQVCDVIELHPKME